MLELNPDRVTVEVTHAHKEAAKAYAARTGSRPGSGAWCATCMVAQALVQAGQLSCLKLDVDYGGVYLDGEYAELTDEDPEQEFVGVMHADLSVQVP